MRVGILGPLEVERDGVALAVGGGRLRALLARLALDAGRPVTTGRLVDALWDGAPPADELHALQSLISRLRRSLGGGVVAEPGGYRLDLSAADVDVGRFERLAAEGAAARAAGEHERAASTLREALGLWRGPALADVVEYRFASEAARRLEEQRLAALADRIDADLTLGASSPQLVGELEALNAANPLHERLAAQLIAALYAAGRQADALAAYERVRTRLADELGAAPSPELQAAHLAVLRGERQVRRGNLPAPVTSFVGRARELGQIRELLTRGRLVTLIGPGGAGKTRLAREAVAGCGDVADGVWMVELAPVTSELEVIPAVLGVLGAREALIDRSGHPIARDALTRLLDVLVDREAVLVLDNCEHLIGAVAELAERLLAGAPKLRIVATSREPLAIAGEHLAPVPPLELPEIDADVATALQHPAVQLFADRAAAARPGFVVDEGNVAAVIEICRRLDGLPLALELAAARARTLPVHDVAARLDDRFRLLTGGSRTALPRHRTLRAVVDWSWDLLPEPERVLARRLAVFGAGATVESASAVCGSDDALDGLAALVDRSLLGPGPRHRMLETIREYGLDRLEEAGELAATRDAHARYFTQLVADAEKRLHGPEQIAWFTRLRDERENVLAALRHLISSGDAQGAISLAIALFPFWFMSGSPQEITEWMGLAAAVPGEIDPADRAIADVVVRLSEAEYRLGVDDTQLTEAMVRLEAVDDTHRPYVALAKPVLAMLGAPAQIDEQLADAFAHPDPWVRAAAHLLRANVDENNGEVERMDGDLDAAIEGFRAIGDGWGVAVAQVTQSGRLVLVGDLAGAEVAAREARDRFATLEGFAGSAMLTLRLADIRLRGGDVEGACELATHALTEGELGGEEMAILEAALGRMEYLAGDLEGARERVARAGERLARTPQTSPARGHAQAIVLASGARLALAAGENADAQLAEAIQIALATSDQPIVATVAVVLALAAEQRGDLEVAGELLGAAAVVRGGEDATDPEIARLRAVVAPAAYASALALGREDALARFSSMTPVRG